MFNLKKIKERREKQKKYIRDEIKSIVKEAMDEWAGNCEYLTTQTDKEARYYCSKADCEGVRFSDETD